MTAHRYDLTREDQIKFVNRIADWHVRLGLGDWHCLSVEMLPELDALAKCHVFVEATSYRIECRTYWDIPVCDQNIDYIACHELMHVVLGPLAKFAFNICAPGLNLTLENLEHSAIARLCNALAHPVKVVRGIDNIEEVNRADSRTVPAETGLAPGGYPAFEKRPLAQELADCKRYYAVGSGKPVLMNDPMEEHWRNTAQDAMQRDLEPVHGDLVGNAAKRWWQVSARDSNWLNGFTREGLAVEAFCAGATWAAEVYRNREG